MSGFTIPNTPDSFNQNQAEPDSLDFQILGNQKSGVVSGLVVAPGSATQTVTVSAGEVLINGAYYPYAGGTVALSAYTSTAFFDIIHARLSGSTVTCYAVRPATGSTNPRFPSSGTGTNDVNLDSTDVVLAAVWRVDSGIPVAQAITDKRIFVRSSTARTLTDTVSANRGLAADTYVNTAWTPNSTTASPFSVKVGSTWYNLSYWTANSNISTSGTITAGSFVGNSSSATVLENTRTIGGVSFNGSANINLPGVNTSGNQNTSGNSSSATLASKASTLAQNGGNGTAMTFNWAGQGGQPSWLWGSNDGSSHYVYDPSNFNVSYASSAGAVTWANVSGKPSIGDVFNNGGTYSINITGSASTAGYLSAIVNVDPLTGPYLGWSNALGVWSASGSVFFGNGFSTNSTVSLPYVNTYGGATSSGGTTALVRQSTNGNLRILASRRELKTNINDYSDGLTIIKNLRPRIFNWKPQPGDQELDITEKENLPEHGFIVEEVFDQYPELVSYLYEEDGSKNPVMWKTNDVISILVQAVKELSAKVEALEAQ